MERAELRDCNLAGSDFYAAKLPGSQILGCDLSRADLSKADLTGTRMQRSDLTDLRGGDSLRGVTISSDQVIPAALAVFASMKIAHRRRLSVRRGCVYQSWAASELRGERFERGHELVELSRARGSRRASPRGRR